MTANIEAAEFPTSYDFLKSLDTPAHVSCLSFGHAGHLFVGSDDGSLRVYDLSTFRVLKAIRGLGEEISSLVCVKRPGSELRDVWLACGKRITKFQMESSKMILTPEDAVSSVEIEGPEEDVLNELCMNADKTHIAFCMDSGLVGVLELSTLSISKMQTTHESVCGNVKFLLSHPRELVSGGYDQKLIHFDSKQGTLLSSCQMPPSESSGGIGLSPPFIMSTAISSAGTFIAGTADGRLWISPGAKIAKGKKKPKIWPGLNEDTVIVQKVAEGPIVTMAFDNTGVLTISTLLGVITRFELVDGKDGDMELKKLWQQECRKLNKVNAVVVDEKRVIVGGFATDGRGVVEIWRKTDEPRSDSTEIIQT